MEKTLILGMINGRRRRGQERMRWLDGITDSMGMRLSLLQDIVKDREACHAIVHGVAKVRHDWGTEQQTALSVAYPLLVHGPGNECPLTFYTMASSLSFLHPHLGSDPKVCALRLCFRSELGDNWMIWLMQVAADAVFFSGAKTGFSSKQKKWDPCSREFTTHLSGQFCAVVLKAVLET